MTDPVGVPSILPVQRPGEIYRHVADPAKQGRTPMMFLYLGLLELVTLIVLGLLVEPPGRWVLFGLGVAGFAMFILLLYPRAKRRGARAGDDLIDLIVTTSGPITCGGFQLSWRELSRFRLDVTTNVGGKGKVGMHAVLELVEPAAVEARTATHAQRSVFTGKGVTVNLGVPEKREAERAHRLLEQACASAGVPFDYRERRTS